MSRAIVPIANLARRIPEAGRIRIGVKAGRAMRALNTFRFTSHDEEALRQVAGIYGGAVKPWSDPKAAEGQFEVITEASEIRIVLPPDPLGGTPIYEMWGGGGCERRCDGLTAEVNVSGDDGTEKADVPCVCAAKGAMACNVVTRLAVILPEIRFGGVWRLDSKSWNVAQEMPGMVALIQSLQDRGLTRGVLALKHRRSVTAGETHRFIVPVLGVDETVEALAAGDARLGALPPTSAPMPAIEQRSSAGEGVGNSPSSTEEAGSIPAPDASPAVDDSIVDAEVVEPQRPAAPKAPTAKKAAPPAQGTEKKRNPYAQALHVFGAAVAKATGLDADLLVDAAVLEATGGESTSANDLNRFSKDIAVVCLARIRDGEIMVVSHFDDAGRESYRLEDTKAGVA